MRLDLQQLLLETSKAECMKKNEKIVICIALIVIVSLSIRAIWKHNQINKDPVFVLAKVTSMADTENGLIFYFNYQLNDKKYSASSKGAVPVYDSLIILKISKSKPQLLEIVNENIPKCILSEDSLNKYWDTLPVCK